MIRHLVSRPSLRCCCSPSRGRGVNTASNRLLQPASMASNSAIALSGGQGGGSRTNEPVSGAGSAPEAAAGEDAEYGFQRRGFGKGPLVGTVHQYDRHLFLCYKSPEVWPPNVEGSESDLLPRCLAGEIKTWQSSIDKKVSPFIRNHWRSVILGFSIPWGTVLSPSYWKYAGNVIIYSPNDNGEVSGHWGQMGLSVDEQKAAQNLRLQLDGGSDESTKRGSTGITSVGGCCQGVGNATCCQVMPKESPENHIAQVQEAPDIAQKSSGKDTNAGSSKDACSGKLCAVSTWFKSWEREDTYAALAVVSAIASVAVAYSCYRQLR
ncbi:hypothetical protein BHE74_00022017 [Ensete ventricosum]|nr:hypothetical protein BHE74_00022017 [Ensete ventricosum]